MADDIQKLPVDGAGKPLVDGVWLPYRASKIITFTGGTTNAWGDDGGTLDGGAVFRVTGAVRVRVFGVVTTDLVGAATINMGTSKTVAGIIAQVADATDLDQHEIWHDATPDANPEASSVAGEKIIANGLDINLYNGTTNITAGVIKFYCSWFPISKDGRVFASEL